MKKRGRGRNIIFFIIVMLLGRILSVEMGKRMEILAKKIKILNNRVGEEYQVVENFLHPRKFLKRSNISIIHMNTFIIFNI